MQPEIFYALICLVCLGLSDFLYRFGQRYDLRPAPFMLLQNLAYICCACLFGVFNQQLSWNTGLIYGVANGWLAFFAFLFVLLALARGEIIRLVPLIRLNFAITAALTIVFLGESINLSRIIGLALCAAAILTIGASRRQSRSDRIATLFAVGAMLSFGLMGLLFKLGLGAGATPGAMVLAQSLGVFSLALPFAIYRRQQFVLHGGKLWIPICCGTLTALSYIALATAFTHGDAVVVAPIAQLSFVLAVSLSVIFLGERLSLNKVSGILFATGGIVILALS